MGTYLVIALRNLALARRRSLLLAAALALVAMFLVLLMSLSQGLRDTVVYTSTLLSSGHVNIAGFYKAKPDDAFPIISGRERLREIGAAAPGVVRVTDRGRGWAKLVSESGSLQTGLVGIDVREEKELFQNLQLAPQSEYRTGGEPRVVGDVQRLREPNTALIFVGQAKRLGVDVGDSITITVESFGGLANTGELTVVAVARDMGFMTNWNVFMPKEAINDLYRLNADVTGSVMLYLDDIHKVPLVMEHLRQSLSSQGYALMEPEAQPFWAKFETVSAEDWTGQKIDLTTWEDETSHMKWMLSALDTIAFLLTSVLLGIIVVGIMNAMWIAVRERTQEIGTLRAIGMRRSRVLLMFMTEATVLGLVATTVGVSLGALLASGLNALKISIGMDAMRAILMSDTLRLSVSAGQVVGPIIAFTLVAMLAALWPALRAARLQPVTAIHKIG